MFQRLNSKLDIERFWYFCLFISIAEINICLLIASLSFFVFNKSLVGIICSVLGFLLLLSLVDVNNTIEKKWRIANRDRIQNMIMKNFNK